MNFNNNLRKLAYYFKDSYGVDKLSKYLIISALVLSFNKITIILSTALVIYATWRALSKNKYKRYQELAAFENLLKLIKQKFYIYKTRFNDFKEYKILSCPKCSQKLRVPRGKGKLIVTCKKCGDDFKAKS